MFHIKLKINKRFLCLTCNYITLLLKYGEKITNETKKYLETMGKIFTASEFYTHLCIFFTKFPLKPTKKENKIKEQSEEEINNILKEIFDIKKDMILPEIKVYFIDTEFDEDTETFDETSPETIDIILKKDHQVRKWLQQGALHIPTADAG